MKIKVEDLRILIERVVSQFQERTGKLNPFPYTKESFEELAKHVNGWLNKDTKKTDKPVSFNSLYFTLWFKAKKDPSKEKPHDKNMELIDYLCYYAYGRSALKFDNTIFEKPRIETPSFLELAKSEMKPVSFKEILPGLISDSKLHSKYSFLFPYNNVFVKDETGIKYFSIRESHDIFQRYSEVISNRHSDEPIKDLSVVQKCKVVLYLLNFLENGGFKNKLRILCRANDETSIKVFKKIEKEKGTCIVYTIDVESLKNLTNEHILHYTNNPNGISIKSEEFLKNPKTLFKAKNNLYSEILEVCPDYVFLPYITGEIYNGTTRQQQELEDNWIGKDDSVTIYGVREREHKVKNDNEYIKAPEGEYLIDAKKIIAAAKIPTNKVFENTFAYFLQECVNNNKANPLFMDSKFVILNIGNPEANPFFEEENKNQNKDQQPVAFESQY